MCYRGFPLPWYGFIEGLYCSVWITCITSLTRASALLTHTECRCARSLTTHHYILYFSQQTARLILVEFLDTYLVQGTRARKRRSGTKMVKEVAARESSHGEQPRLLQVSHRRQNRDHTARRQCQNLPAHPRPRTRIPLSRWKGVYQSRSWTTTATRSKRIRRPCDSTGKAACYSLPYAASKSSFWYVAKKAVFYL